MSLRASPIGPRIFLAALALGWACLIAAPRPAHAITIVRFATNVGHIDVRLFDTATPLSVANFLNYVNTNRYQDTFIHRTPPNFVVQGGGFKLNNSIFQAAGIVTDAPIGNEPGLTNIEGTLAFAKNSLGATSQWFFNVDDNSGLDNDDFTVFGRVIRNRYQTVEDISDLALLNAAVAENAPGEDFDEIPVTDLEQVLAQQDVTNDEAVVINNVFVLPLETADYNFDREINLADWQVWREQYGNSLRIADHDSGSPGTEMEADGNGDGVVDVADYAIWREAFLASGAAGASFALPEPSSCVLLLFGSLLLARRRR